MRNCQHHTKKIKTFINSATNVLEANGAMWRYMMKKFALALVAILVIAGSFTLVENVLADARLNASNQFVGVFPSKNVTHNNTLFFSFSKAKWIPFIPGTGPGAPEVKLKSSDNKGIAVYCSVPGMYVVDIPVGDDVYQRLDIPMRDTLLKLENPNFP